MPMKNILFPHICRPIGWIFFAMALILGALVYFGVLALTGLWATIINDIVIVGITSGGLLIVCSKERMEDEMTKSIRLSALLNAIYADALIVITSTILINGADFLEFSVLNLMLLPVLFVCDYTLEMRRYNRMYQDEE